jgi:hypothetical protein
VVYEPTLGIYVEKKFLTSSKKPLPVRKQRLLPLGKAGGEEYQRFK